MVSLDINDLFMLIFVHADTIVLCFPAYVKVPLSTHTLCRFKCWSFANLYYDCYSLAVCNCVDVFSEQIRNLQRILRL